ncbi:MAG: hypothetical protein A2Z37_12535 [Chloroflexi bacterium RBG_19FT_COMBO_62_14]|nr:MAG: hypothetical protein A2Z37_12535 [Chloroflexi bacterium RBG_19FT_COMBO_62_14]
MVADLDSARRYSLTRLQTGLPRHYYYHSPSHTHDEVAPAAEELAALEGITDEERLLLLTAAYFHDIGYVEQIDGHEAISVRIAGEVLPGLGYTPEHMHAIEKLILATRLPHAPGSHLEMLLVDADLDHLGRKEYWKRQDDLRRELAALGSPMTDRVWYERQLHFMNEHRYFTGSANRLWLDRKNQNITLITRFLRRCEAT